MKDQIEQIVATMPQVIHAKVDWLPSDPPRPVPPIMDDEDAALYLRVVGGAAQRKAYMKRARRAGLRYTRVQKMARYKREWLEEWLEFLPSEPASPGMTAVRRRGQRGKLRGPRETAKQDTTQA